MEQDASFMRFLEKVRTDLKNTPGIQVLSHNFTEEPGVHVLSKDEDLFIPCSSTHEQYLMEIKKIQKAQAS